MVKFSKHLNGLQNDCIPKITRDEIQQGMKSPGRPPKRWILSSIENLDATHYCGTDIGLLKGKEEEEKLYLGRKKLSLLQITPSYYRIYNLALQVREISDYSKQNKTKRQENQEK